MNPYDAVSALASTQHGLVARRQVAELGMSPFSLARAIASGRLEELSPRVLRLPGAPDTDRQRAMAATLDVRGSALALYSAASLWRIQGYDLEPAHVIAGRSPHRDRARLGRMHSSTRFDPSEITTLDGIPVTTPLRTLRDLAARVHFDRLALTCDRMIGRRLLTIEAVHALVGGLPARGGAAGTGALRRLASTRPPGYRPADSNLERRFESIVERAGDPAFERQVDVGDEDGWIGRVDFIDRHLRVIVEVQSALFHGGLLDRERDAIRLDRLRKAGWIVVEVTDDEVWYRESVVIAKVRAARSRARQRWLTR